MHPAKASPVFRLHTADDLTRIPFHGGMAAVEVPAALLGALPLVNWRRGESPRLTALKRSIRAKGYQPLEPITVRVEGPDRWVVLNGGHRITAAKQVMEETWSNLFGPKVRSLYFVLFLDTPEAQAENAASRALWERARRRNRDIDLPPPESGKR